MTLLMWLLFLSGFLMTTGGSAAAYLVATRSQTAPDGSEDEIQAELRLKEQEIADRELFAAIEKEAKALAQLIPEQLATQNKLQHVTREPGQKRRKNLIRFEAIMMTRTEIWFRFDGRRLPYGVSFADMKDPNNAVIDNLQYGINRPCRFYEDSRFNLFLRVGLKNSLMGIPKRVKWADVIEHLPKSRPYAVAMGVNEYNKLIYQDITEWPHGLIAGATGMGKTTALTQILITLIKRNPPGRLKFCLVDLKRTELMPFMDVPHTLRYGDLPEEALDIFTWLENEMERRYALIKGQARDIRGWNREMPHKRLPRIVLVVDELASITTDPELGKKSLHRLVKLAQKGRSAGIHLLLCTQFISAKVLPMEVTTNIDGRLCFGVSTLAASVLVMGSGVAYGHSHVGRCVYRSGPKYLTLQSPYADDKEVLEIIEAAKGGKSDDTEEDGIPTTHLDLLKIALHNYGGKVAYMDIWQSVRDAGGQIGQKRLLSMLAAATYTPENQQVWTIDNERYIVLPPIMTDNGKYGRQLARVNGELPQTDAEIEALAMAYIRGVDILHEGQSEDSPGELDGMHTSANGIVHDAKRDHVEQRDPPIYEDIKHA